MNITAFSTVYLVIDRKFKQQFINNDMKPGYLSSFQKEQYTAYIENQLEKFSAFMLGQKKQNERYRIIEDTLSYHSKKLEQHESKIQVNHINIQECINYQSNLQKTMKKYEDWEYRLSRLEDRDRFNCDHQARKRYSQHQVSQNDSKNIDWQLKQISKKIKKLEESSYKKVQLPSYKLHHNETSQEILEDIVSKKSKKLQKKISKFINKKMEELEQNLKIKKRKKSVSPSILKTNQLSAVSQYQIESHQPLSHFRLSQKQKSDVSTVERQSKVSSRIVKSNKNKQQQKKRSKSRSVSRSKSKSKNNKKDQKRSKKSKRHRNDSSFISVSDASIIKSSISRSKSKSKTSRIKDNAEKDKKHSKKLRNRSKSRSVSASSISKSYKSRSPGFHENCKKPHPHNDPYTSTFTNKSKQKVGSSKNRKK